VEIPLTIANALLMHTLVYWAIFKHFIICCTGGSSNSRYIDQICFGTPFHKFIYQIKHMISISWFCYGYLMSPKQILLLFGPKRYMNPTPGPCLWLPILHHTFRGHPNSGVYLSTPGHMLGYMSLLYQIKPPQLLPIALVSHRIGPC